jgi:hypothetical protein
VSADRSAQYHYSIFGLELASDLALPELRPAAPSDAPNIVISVGEIADAERDPGLYNSAEGALLIVDEVARYAVRDGTHILVEPRPGAPLANVRLFLLGSAMGMLIHQRGLLPLHGNAIDIAGRAYAFVGHSGAGKSTLAAWFHDQGYRILSDDVCVVRFDGTGNPLLSAGIPRLRLWREAIEASGRVTDGYDRSYAGDEAYDKYDVPVAAAAMVDGALPLAAVYSLRRGDGFSVDRLGPVDSAEVLFANTYRGAYLGQTATNALHWQACVDVVRRVPVFDFVRTWALESLGEQAGQVAAHARALATQPPEARHPQDG